MTSLPERRENAFVLAGTLGIAFLGLLLLFGVSLPGAFFWIVVACAAALAFRAPEVALYGLLFNALIGLTHMADLPRIGALSVPVAFEAVLVLAVAHRAIFRGQKLFVASPQHLLLLGLASWIALSLIVNGRTAPENIAALKNLYLVKMLLLFLMTNILVSLAALKRFIVALMGCNAALLVVSFLVRSGYFGAERLSFWENMLRTSGIVHNPNTLAFDLTTMLIFATAAFFHVKEIRMRVALAVLIIGDFVAILTTLSRSGFVSLCCVLVFIVWSQWRDVRIFAVVMAMIFLTLFLIPEDLDFRFARVEEIKDVDRLSFARVGLNTALHNPVFGVGLGSYMKAFDRYNNTDLTEAHPPHNMYMDLSAQIGFPALAIYLAVFAVLVGRLRAMQAQLAAAGGRGTFLHAFGWAVQAFVVNLAVFGLSGDVQFEYSVFVALGFGILLYREHALLRGFVPPHAGR